MNCSPTLTADEFKVIHNSLYYLDCLGNDKVNDIVAKMRDALKGAYEQDRKAFSSKSDHFDDVRSQLGLNNSVWSIYNVGNLEIGRAHV